MPDLSLLQPLGAALGVSVNELLSGRRLPDAEFRREADENAVALAQSGEKYSREKRLADFLSGGGTGLLASVLLSPPSLRRTLVLILGALMAFAGYYRQGRLSRRDKK